MPPPLIGITADVDADRVFLRPAYCQAVMAAGGIPVILPPVVETVAEVVHRCDGIILSGGDDPIMEPWGETTHPKATPVDAGRQAFEVALLAELDRCPDVPVLGICLGMQLMSLHAGGQLDQYLPDTLPTASQHWGKIEHEIAGPLGSGSVLSHHRQAITDAGSLCVVARAQDAVIEAVRNDDRAFYLGVQWHPERTHDSEFGPNLLRTLVIASASARVIT